MLSGAQVSFSGFKLQLDDEAHNVVWPTGLVSSSVNIKHTRKNAARKSCQYVCMCVSQRKGQRTTENVGLRLHQHLMCALVRVPPYYVSVWTKHTHALSARSKLEANWGIGLLAYFRTGQLSKSVQPPWNSYYSHGGRTCGYRYRITSMFFHTGEENRSDCFPNTEGFILFKTQRVWRQKDIFQMC